MKLAVLILSASFALGCATTSLDWGADSVRLTSNPEVVRGCKFITEVKGSDHWNGGIGSGIAQEDAIAEMKNAAFHAGANVVIVTISHTGWSGSDQRGEAYSCGSSGMPAAPSVIPADFIHITSDPREIEGCKEVGPSRVRMTIGSDGKVSAESSRGARELTSQNMGNTLYIVLVSGMVAEATGFGCKR